MAKRKTNSQFVAEASRKHNYKYIYNKTKYVNNNTKVTITCSVHGDFKQLPTHHLAGSGCKKCGYLSQRELKRKDQEQFIIEANKVHGNYYYQYVNYINNNLPVKILCKDHGFFYQTPGNHLSGKGCAGCANRGKLSKKQLIKRANKVHNNSYNYNNVVFVNFHEKIEIICPNHGSFYQTPSNHIHGKQGCPKCSNRSSYLENKWLDSLGVKNRQVKLIIDGQRFWVDGYDVETKTIYEFYGDFWHGNPKKYDPKDPFLGKLTMEDKYKQTIEREKRLIKHGFSVVSIWESEFNELDN